MGLVLGGLFPSSFKTSGKQDAGLARPDDKTDMVAGHFRLRRARRNSEIAAGLPEPGEARRAGARKAHECLRRRAAALASAKGLHYLVVLPIDAFAVLAFVGEQSGLLLFANGGDIDVIRGMEAHRLGAEIDLVVEQLEAAPTGQPRPIGQDAGGLMIEVRVDGPLR